MAVSDLDPLVERTFRGLKAPVRAAVFTRSMRQVATAGDDHVVTIWNFKSDMRAFRFVGHTAPVLGLDFSSSGRLLASASKDGTLRFWQPRLNGSSTVVNAHTSAAVHSVSLSHDDQYALTASNDKTIKKWEINSHRFHSSFLGHQHWVRSAQFSPDGRLLVSGGDDKTVRLWDSNTQRNIQTFYETNGAVLAVRFFPSGTLVAGAGHDGSINLWDIRTNKLLQHYNAHSDAVTCIDFHPTGDYLISASSDASIKAWDLREGHQMYTMHGHKSCVRSVVFSPEGHHFASAGDDKLLMIWKTNFDQPIQKQQQLKAPSKHRPIPTEGKEVRTTTLHHPQPRPPTDIVAEPPTINPQRDHPNKALEDSNDDGQPRTTTGPELAAALSQIVAQLDLIRETMSLFDRRLTVQEAIVGSMASGKPSQGPVPPGPDPPTPPIRS